MSAPTKQHAVRWAGRWIIASVLLLAAAVASQLLDAAPWVDAVLGFAGLCCYARFGYWSGWLARDARVLRALETFCRAEPPPPALPVDAADHPHWCGYVGPHQWHRCHGCILEWKLADPVAAQESRHG